MWGLGGGNGIGVPPIVNWGNQEQKDRFLPGVANGTIRFCLGITEPDGKSLSYSYLSTVSNINKLAPT
jgi:alkylation response protein AidB-like acyl-CoA dehydrogenase